MIGLDDGGASMPCAPVLPIQTVARDYFAIQRCLVWAGLAAERQGQLSALVIADLRMQSAVGWAHCWAVAILRKPQSCASCSFSKIKDYRSGPRVQLVYCYC